MNRNLFTSKLPGRLKEIRILNQEDWAFVPDDPPSRMKMPERIWKLLTMAQSELTRLDGVAMHIPNYELLDGVRGSQKDPGNFRRTQVYIGSDRGFIPPPPDVALECLYRLESYIHAKNDIPPLILSFLTHYQFETIHPFGDGNGRTGRLLLSLMIFKGANCQCAPYSERLQRFLPHGSG